MTPCGHSSISTTRAQLSHAIGSNNSPTGPQLNRRREQITIRGMLRRASAALGGGSASLSGLTSSFSLSFTKRCCFSVRPRFLGLTSNTALGGAWEPVSCPTPDPMRSACHPDSSAVRMQQPDRIRSTYATNQLSACHRDHVRASLTLPCSSRW